MIAAILLGTVAGVAGPQAPPHPGALVFQTRSVDFGETFQFATVEGRFEFTNRGARPVTIHAQPSLPTATALVRPEVVPPGEHGSVTVRVPVGDRLGQTGFRVVVTTDDPARPEFKLALTGFVQSAFAPESALADLGFVERSRGGEVTVELTTREAASLRVLAIEGAPAWLEARALASSEPGQTAGIRLAIRAGAPLGRHLGMLRVRTDVNVQAEYWLRFAANVFGPVVPGENPVDLGLLRVGDRKVKSVTLTRRDGLPLVVERVADVPPGLAVDDGPCDAPPAGSSCRVLTLAAAPTTSTPLQGRLLLYLLGEPEPLPIDYGAIVVGREARVTDLGDLTPSQTPAVPPPAAPPQAGLSLRTPTAGPAPPVGAGSAPEAAIRWQASKEEQVFGYLVYRSESRIGPFVRSSRETVRVPADGEHRHSYRFVDTDVRPGATYYYYIDAVGTGGAKQRFSPVVSKTIPPAPAPSPGR